MLSTKNIAKLAEKAGKVIEIDWKDTPTLSKWYVTPRALVRVPVATPLCPGKLINRKNGTSTWVYFKYEHVKTSCYDCGILGHEQSHCASETPEPPNLYGPWLRFDNQMDLPPPLAITAQPLPEPISSLHYPEPDSPTPTSHDRTNPKKLGQEVKLNQSGGKATLSNDNDNSLQPLAIKGRSAHQASAFLTVAGSKEAEDDSSFLSRSHGDPNFSTRGERAARKVARACSLSIDDLYSGIIYEQAQAKAQFQATTQFGYSPDPHRIATQPNSLPSQL
ncbi:hypothetical protein CRG98_043603 [Punica granatum]|uniref:CCHC-type domain-containing protein n=1 Tax=Punica granatum TaxID=22663 RepID=A0A2I0HWG8_PUNGR|nr:hypothetical protein CRG98_043603 [Punica granatum]